jgi:hypothetical protein
MMLYDLLTFFLLFMKFNLKLKYGVRNYIVELVFFDNTVLYKNRSTQFIRLLYLIIILSITQKKGTKYDIVTLS